MNRKLLGIYLNDHLAGSVAGVELARRARGANEDSELGEFLARLASDLEADQRRLKELMARLGVRRDHAKAAAGWLGEKLGRLKLNGQLTGYSPLSRLVELEALALGVTAKLALWRTLRDLAGTEPALNAEELDELIERAEEQRRGIEEHRLPAAQTALAGTG